MLRKAGLQKLALQIAVAMLTLGTLVPVQAANIFEKGIYMTGPRFDGDLPACEAGLSTIASRFATKESRFWNSSLEIVDFERVRQVAYRPWAEGTIPRRFCTAVARVTDGKKRVVNYWIGEDTSEIGWSWGVEFCVVGLDRSWAYNPRCKMALP
jgi:hypothetical protein